MIRAAAALATVLGTAFPAAAEPAFPAVDCAALWAATAWFRASHATDDASAAAATRMAAAFRDAALAGPGADPGAVDRKIAALAPVYMLLLEAYILDGDRDSRDQYEWLMTLCQRFLDATGGAGGAAR